VLEFVVVEVGSAQRHHQVAQTDQRRVRVGEKADDHVAVEYRHRGLISVLISHKKALVVKKRVKKTYQYAVLEILCWAPVEHASRVILHLRLLKVKVLGLVVSDAHGHLVVVLAVLVVTV